MISGWETGIPSMPSRMVFCRAQMGMASSAKWLEVALAKTLAQAHGKYLRWADDIVVIGKDDEDVLCNLSCVLDLLSSHGWKIKQEKLTIFAKQLLVFGMKIDLESQQISIPRADLDAVLLRARPASPAEMRSFCGSVAWFAENLGNHAHASALLHKMTRKDASYTWTEENLQAYETIQEFMSKPAMYTSLPNFDLPFHMVSDSSEHATGCLLLQMPSQTDLRIISYKSHIHDLRTSRLSSHERESYAMIYCISSFYDIIWGDPPQYTPTARHQCCSLSCLEQTARWPDGCAFLGVSPSSACHGSPVRLLSSAYATISPAAQPQAGTGKTKW